MCIRDRKVTAADGTIQIIKIRVGITGFLNAAPVDTQLLPEFPYHAVFGLLGQKHIQVNAIARIHQ